MQTFLILYANPVKGAILKLDQEFRAIQDELEKENRPVQLVNIGKVRKEDLSRKLSRYKPTVVQFSGHANGKGEIVLENSKGKIDIVDRDMLEAVFKNHAGPIRCVILNCCYSNEQAKAINRHIPFVIGMAGDVPDSHSRTFSVKFLSSLAEGHSIQDSFDIAKTEMGLINSQYVRIPKLFVKPGNDAVNFRLIEPPRILARFKLTKDGKPKKYKAGKHLLYEMEVFIKNAPAETSVVLYQYVDEFWELSDQVEEIPHSVPEFTDTLDENGNIEIRASLWSPLGGTAIREFLCDALKNFYGKAATPVIKAAIEDIRNYNE